MNYKELNTKSEAALRKDLSALQAKAQDLRLKLKLGQVKNVRELAEVRKDIARILTYLRAN